MWWVAERGVVASELVYLEPISSLTWIIAWNALIINYSNQKFNIPVPPCWESAHTFVLSFDFRIPCIISGFLKTTHFVSEILRTVSLKPSLHRGRGVLAHRSVVDSAALAQDGQLLEPTQLLKLLFCACVDTDSGHGTLYIHKLRKNWTWIASRSPGKSTKY